jgi:hypothetical protein
MPPFLLSLFDDSLLGFAMDILFGIEVMLIPFWDVFGFLTPNLGFLALDFLVAG